MVKRQSTMSGYYRQRKRRNVNRRRRRVTSMKSSRFGLLARRTRRTFRRKFPRRQRVCNGIPYRINAWMRSIEYTAIVSVAGNTQLLHYSDALLSADTNIAAELVKYVNTYDAFMPLKVLIEVWVNDNDDLTTANLAYPRMQWYNDMFSEGKTMFPYSVATQDKRQEVFLKPMQKFWHQLKPKFRQELFNGAGNTPAQWATSTNRWRSTSQLSPTSIPAFVSQNGIQAVFIGAPTNEVRYRYHLQFGWKMPRTTKVYGP